MKISRENYEIWFTDWMDNNLSGTQVEELNFFLDQNPDLRDEFTDLCVLRLKPVESPFLFKGKLKRLENEMPEKQFELLCAASVENDLDPDQETEFKEIVSSSPEREKTLQIFRLLKLKPGDVVYKGKKKLLHKTAAAKIIRIAQIGLSAAAIVLIAVITGVFEGEVKQQIITSPVSEVVTDPIPESNGNNNTSSTTPVSTPSKNTIDNEHRVNQVAEPDNIQATEKIVASAPEKVNFSPDFQLPEPQVEYGLVASSAVYNPPAIYYSDEDRSKLGRFIASRFRSGILNEADPSDAPLKSYEIAEAGIDGLNKLLGWEMALTRNNDENGETQSVQFNSRLLKFNTPVKNNQQAE